MADISVTESKPLAQQSILDRLRQYWPRAILCLVVLLAIYLRFYLLGAGGLGNPYLAAAVRSMLTSWHNFLFVAFEPGGSVAIDKPPLGFWIESASALVFGFNGFALALPNAVAGVLSIPLLYQLVRRPFGAAAGLVAALALTLMPITVDTERNNTIDGMLAFTLLLAAWAFLRAVRSGKRGHLMLGAFILGLGFNIKMLEAFTVLPAFYLLYLLGARIKWPKRILNLALATILLLVVSFGWIVAVDSVPASQRPFVGNSGDNSEMSLAFGWNGLYRIVLGGSLPSSQPPSPAWQKIYGVPGALRLFTGDMAEQASWLLPLALFSIGLTAAVLFFWWRWKKISPDSNTNNIPGQEYWLGFILWGAWLFSEAFYFSFTSGHIAFHYMVTMCPAIAAMAGISAWSFSQAIKRWRWPAYTLLVLVVEGSLIFQLSIILNYERLGNLGLFIALFCVAGCALLAWRPHGCAGSTATAFIAAGLLAAPLVWCGAVTLFPKADNTATLDAEQTNRGFNQEFAPLLGASYAPPPILIPSNVALVNFFESQYTPGDYLFATDAGLELGPFISYTGQPILPLEGFDGDYNMVNVPRLAALVQSGELRFVMISSEFQKLKPDLFDWIKQGCAKITFPAGSSVYVFGQSEGRYFLYDCHPASSFTTPQLSDRR